MLNDPIADMLTRVRNAIQQRHKYVDVSMSRMIVAILTVLKEGGFVKSMALNQEKRLVRVYLSYNSDRESAIQGLKRVSKPGRRIYVGWPDVPVIRRGLGLSVVSTSKGVMSGTMARKEKIGGELICCIW
jgi:small subunit ribosomal protein S8